MTTNINYRISKSNEDYEKIMELRDRVFIKEQNIPAEIEYDELDKTSIQLGGFSDEKIIACGRIVATDDNSIYKIGRIAVDKDYRGLGIGFEICKNLIEIVKNENGSIIYIHAQVYAVPFYEKLGFLTDGEIFLEADIPHIEMVLKLN